MPVKRRIVRVNLVVAPRDPHGTAKATLLEVQSRSVHRPTRRYVGYMRRHLLSRHFSTDVPSPREWDTWR